MQVYTVLIDNQDGGYTLYGFATVEERDAFRQKQADEGGYSLDDEYETGYPGEETLDIIVDKDGTPRLAAPFSIHAGQ